LQIRSSEHSRVRGEMINPAAAQRRGGLAGDEQAVRMFRFFLRVSFDGIVDADDIDLVGHQSAVGAPNAGERRGGVPGCIVSFDDRVQLSGDGRAAITDVILFRYFVADAPQNDRRMIAITQNHVRQIPFVPLVEIEVIIVFRLGQAPDVKGLHHHQ